MGRPRVLVTGAGSGVGQGVLKALRLSRLNPVLIAADVGPLNAALYRADEALLIPKVENEPTPATIMGLLKAANIDVVMVGSEFDLMFFARHRAAIEKGSGATVVVSPADTVEIADDKFATAEFLKAAGLPYAESFVPDGLEQARAQAARWKYPVLLKPRRGTSSRHVHVLRSDAELVARFAEVPGAFLQRLIGMPSASLENEYTCSVFKTKDGRLIGPFTARRTLRSGHSWVVEVAPFKRLHPLLLEIGRRLPAMGSVNVQLMVGEDGPVPFEFNARFSGTTAVRAHFGFNEPDMALRHFHLGEELSEPEIRAGMAFRYAEEVFIEGAAADDLKEPYPKGVVNRWF